MIKPIKDEDRNYEEFPILYKYTQKSAIQQWQIIANEDHFYTIEGQKDGKLTTSKPTYCTPKNVGRANETTAEEQALAEAKAKHQKKLDKGYNEILTDEKAFFEPMLAHGYDDHKHKIDWKEDRVFVQPKLDGLRGVNDGKIIMSRNGKPYVAVPHLLHKYDVTFDGELYTHTFKDDFNKIVSLCKKQKPTDEEIAEAAEKVEYWVYDYPSHNGVFSERYKALTEVKDLPKNFVIVPTYEVKSEQEIKDWHAKFLGEGYEGTIVRVDAPYKNGRSDKLLKFKDFVDEEFTIVGFEEGTGGRVGTIGFFVMQHDKNPNQTFKSNVKGNFDYLKEVWRDRESYIGKSATVKYFNRTPKQDNGSGDVPRFPYIIKINREEYE